MKKIIFFGLCFILLSPFFSSASEIPNVESKIFQNVWKKFSEISNDAVEYATNSDRNSRTALEFLTAREPKYVRLIKKAQDILADSEAREQFDAIDELLLKNKELEKEITQLKRERITVPDSSLNPLATTKQRIDKRLAKISEEIIENQSTMQSLQLEILEILRRSGLNISPEELNYFLISAEGSELIRLMSIAENMKKIQIVIERELQIDKNNIGLAKSYTGMYLISLETYLSAHDVAIEKISEYRERVKNILKNAMQNYDDAVSLKKSAAQSDIQNLDANININEKTISVANLYDTLLERRKKFLLQSKVIIKKKVDLARNTYKTIVNGSSLISLVNTESGEFALLVNFDMPELKVIYDSAMLNAFVDISEKIKNEK